MHQGPEADSSTIVCWADVSAIARCFFTRGGSLLVTGFVATSPHFIARENADETNPAMFRTVFALKGRAAFVRRSCPPTLQEPMLFTV